MTYQIDTDYGITVKYPYYDNTQQVRYLSSLLEKKYSYGIAYHDFIIDSEAGEVIKIKNLFEPLYFNTYTYDVTYNDIVVELSWNDLTKVIKE